MAGLMAIVYYDNLEATQADDTPGLVEVERIYCFDWDRFHDNDWQELTHLQRFAGDSPLS